MTRSASPARSGATHLARAARDSRCSRRRGTRSRRRRRRRRRSRSGRPGRSRGAARAPPARPPRAPPRRCGRGSRCPRPPLRRRRAGISATTRPMASSSSTAGMTTTDSARVLRAIHASRAIESARAHPALLTSVACCVPHLVTPGGAACALFAAAAQDPGTPTPSRPRSSTASRSRSTASCARNGRAIIFQAHRPGPLAVQVRPRVEIGVKRLLLGVGGEINYSSDENTDVPGRAAAGAAPRQLRFARHPPRPRVRQPAAGVLAAAATAAASPCRSRLTEMIWDRDLRPQGARRALWAAATRRSRWPQRARRARQPRVRRRRRRRCWIVSAGFARRRRRETRLELLGLVHRRSGTWTRWSRVIRRQNTRATAGGRSAPSST